jgi:hypothetical protein
MKEYLVGEEEDGGLEHHHECDPLVKGGVKALCFVLIYIEAGYIATDRTLVLGRHFLRCAYHGAAVDPAVVLHVLLPVQGAVGLAAWEKYIEKPG